MKVRVGSKVKYYGTIYKVAALREKQNGFIIEHPCGWFGDEPDLDPKKCYYYMSFADPHYKVVNSILETEV